MPEKQKIVILGGGVSALTAAFYLTEVLAWQDKYDITLYQMGWRLGGHAATGRDEHNRILEHGLHVWFGCYNNAFRLMRQCYQALDRPSTAPLATLEAAFVPQHFAVYPELINGEWRSWAIDFPPNTKHPAMPEFPDDPASVPISLDAWDTFTMLVEFIQDTVAESSLAPYLHDWRIDPNQLPRWWQGLLQQIDLNLGDPTQNPFLKIAHRLLQKINENTQQDLAGNYQILVWLFRQFKRRMEEQLSPLLDKSDDLRRAWILLDLGLSTVIGMLVDGVVVNGFNPLDHYDLRKWLKKHGAGNYALDSSILRGIYDSFFAYKNGDPQQPDFAAGSALSAVLRVMFDYRGAVMYKMAAGTGDTVIAPLYLVLKERGVKFKFFHRVDRLELDSTQQSIARISLGEQIKVENGDYQPLADFNGLPVWTNEPRYEQLIDGAELQASGQNLEMPWSEWADVRQFTLEAGVDFDTVILGLSYGVLPTVCSELVAASPLWQKSLSAIKTVQIQAAQLWFTPTLKDLGWDDPAPLISGYAKDFSSWAEFSQLLPWEGDSIPAQSVFYTSDVLPDSNAPLNAAYWTKQTAQVYANLTDYLEQHGALIWSAVAKKGSFDWQALAAPASSQGKDRLKAQYWRANVAPADRFVLSPAGGNVHRIKPTETGFTNLYAVGAWTYNWWYNIASMEVAITAGMQVSRAIAGLPKVIVGETAQVS